jgi:hypothetical protein
MEPTYYRPLQIAAGASVAVVYIGPMVVVPVEGLELNTGGLFVGLVAALMVFWVCLVPSAIGWLVQFAVHRRWPTVSALVITAAVPVVVTLPGTVAIHRQIGWYNYLPNIWPSVGMAAVNVLVSSNLAIYPSTRIALGHALRSKLRLRGFGDR